MAAWGSLGSAIGGSVSAPAFDFSDGGRFGGSGGWRNLGGSDPYNINRPTSVWSVTNESGALPAGSLVPSLTDLQMGKDFEQQKQQLWGDAQRRPWQVEDREAGFEHDFAQSDQNLRNQMALELLSQMGLDFQGKRQMDLARLTGSQDLLGNILSQGYIDEAQRTRARSNYNDLKSLFPEAYKGLGQFDDAYGTASGLASTGGMDWGRADATYQDHVNALRAQGYTPAQIDRIVATQGQEVGDQYRAAAEQTFNQSLGGAGSPAMAAAIMAKSAGEVGKAKAGARANAEREQAQMKLQAEQAAAGLGQQMMGLVGQAAQNKVSAAGMLGDIMRGKYGALGDLMGLQGDVAQQLAAIDMKTMPGYAAEIYQRALGGAFDPYADGESDWSARLNDNIAALPDWLQGFVNTGNITPWVDIYEPQNTYDPNRRVIKWG